MNKRGILVISHGSREASWVRLVDDAVKQLPLRGNIPVAASFLELAPGRLIQDGVDMLEGQGVTDILVIPLFVSSGSTHVNEIAYALGAIPAPALETELKPFRVRAKIHFGRPIDDDPDVAQMIWDKTSGLSEKPDREMILLVGHGSVHDGFAEAWARGMASLAESVRRIGGVSAADYAFLNPDIVKDKAAYWAEERGKQVIVAPLFLSDGYFVRTVIPKRLAGVKYRYSAKPLLPHPLLTHWMAKQICEWLEVDL